MVAADAPQKSEPVGLYPVERRSVAERPICGTRAADSAALRAVPLSRELVRPLGAATRESSDVGDIAVVRDDGTIVLRGTGPVDLQGRTLHFAPTAGGGLNVELGGPPVLPADPGVRLTLGDDASVAVAFQGRPFRFYGTEYDEVFVNSNGDLTFGGGDPAVNSPEQFLRAFPRIAALAADLDPSAAGRVSAVHERGRLTVVWHDVPQFGRAAPNTFVISLYENGAFEIGLVEISSPFAPVGITPGGLRPGLTQVDFTQDAPLRDVRGAIAELFLPVGTKLLDLASLGQRFYDTHADEHDTLVLWTDFEFDIRGGFADAFTAVEATVRFSELDQYLMGLRRPEEVAPFWFIDAEPLFAGTIGRIERIPSPPPFPPLDVVIDPSQDFGPPFTLFTSFTSPRTFFLVTNPGTPRAAPAVVVLNGLVGNDVNPGAVSVFSFLGPLGDLASAGDPYAVFVDPSAPPQTNLWDQASGTFAGPPLSVRGERVEVSIADVMAVEGPRRPSAGVQPSEYRQAFLLLVEQGADARPASLDKLERFRAAWVDAYAASTDHRGELVTALTPPGKPRLALATAHGRGRGSSVLTFDTGGRATGAFKPFRGGAAPLGVAAADLGDAREDLVIGSARGAVGQVAVRRADGTTRYTIDAFGARFRDGVRVAAGNLDGRGADEIVAVMAGRGSRVRVFNADGHFTGVEFEPFSPEVARHGAHVAVGDVDADGTAEIIVGSGSGAAPLVRVFDGNGTFTGVEFSPFEPASRGGVAVAVGDLDGDGAAEMLLAPAGSGAPRVQVFDGAGRATGTEIVPEAILDGRSRAVGLTVAAGDLDLDGMAEIIVGSAAGLAPALAIYEGDGSLLRAGRLDLAGRGRVALGIAAGDF